MSSIVFVFAVLCLSGVWGMKLDWWNNGEMVSLLLVNITRLFKSQENE